MENGLLGFPGQRTARTIIADPPAGAARNLRVDNDGTAPNTIVNITASEIVLQDARFDSITARNVSVSLDTTVAGYGGMESGLTVANSTWYARHVIANPLTGQVKGLWSASATAPILPAGYTFWAFTGWHRTNGSALLHRIMQRDRRTQYVVSAAVTTGLFQIVSSLSSAGAWAAASVSAAVPSTATAIGLVPGSTNQASANYSALAPNNNYPLPGGVGIVGTPYYRQFNGAGVGAYAQDIVWMLLESTNVYWEANTSFNLWVMGWDEPA